MQTDLRYFYFYCVLILGFSVQERHGHTGGSPAKDHEDDEGTGVFFLWGDRVGNGQSREEKTQEGLNNYKCTWRESANRMETDSSQWCPGAGQEAVGTNWNTGFLRISRTGNTTCCEVDQAQACCPGRWWSLSLWRYKKKNHLELVLGEWL